MAISGGARSAQDDAPSEVERRRERAASNATRPSPSPWYRAEHELEARFPPSALLFPHLDRWSASDAHRDACKALGVDFADYRMHDARHSYAVRAIRAGAPLEHVARQLGHADTQMVVKVYGRFAPTPDERTHWQRVAELQDAERAKSLALRGA
jgi:integrase